MQCGVIVGSGAQCPRQADVDSEVCAYHRSIAFRRQARALELARLSAEDQEALGPAAALDGLDSEIAVLRVLLRRAAQAGEIDAFRLGIESLRRALLARRRLNAQVTPGLGSTLEAVLDTLGAAAPFSLAEEDCYEESDPATVSYLDGAASITAQDGRAPLRLAQSHSSPTGQRRRLPAASASAPAAGPVHPAQEREAAALVLRYQAGEPEALELLYGLLETTILAVLLHHRDFQSSALKLPELQHHSRTVLADLAQRWRPGVSFLGYFFGGFPTAIARHVQGQQSAGSPALARSAAAAAPAGPVPNAAGSPDVPFSAADLASLPDRERQVVLLRDFAAQSMGAIARQVGVHPSTASVLYRRAHGRLAGRTGSTEGLTQIAMRRLVQALHVAADPEGRMPNRAWAMAAAGLRRIEYEQLIARLEAANAIYGRSGRVPGHLADPTPAATLARVGLSS